MKKIAALLTCFNRKEKTLICLDSLYNATKLLENEGTIDVFLVDDGSTDGTSDEVHAKFPETIIIRGNGNLFWNRGMNLAWKTAANNDYDFYLWLNDDTILLRDSIKNILHDSELKNDESIIAGVCKSKNGGITYSGYNNLKESVKLEPNGSPTSCNCFNGNIVLIPSSVFNRVGLLDPIFHHGKGDFDYGLRAKKYGVDSYISSKYVGLCEHHNELPVWCNPKYPFNERIKSFRSPLGGNPKLTFILQRKYLGLMPATFHYFTIHLRLVWPALWK